MDIKILAAVLASLTAIFAGMNGGVFSQSDIREAQSATGIESPEISSYKSDIPVVGKFFRRAEPENKIQAQIKVEPGSEMNIRKAGLEAKNLREINSPGISIRSDEDVNFKDFQGKVSFGNNTKIKGKSSGLHSSGVNISTKLQLDTDFSTKHIKVKKTLKTNLDFSEADIKPINDSDFPINTENTKVSLKSFTGDINVYTQNRTLNLDGLVHRVEAGKAKYGTE